MSGRLAEQIRIRPVGENFAFASIVCDGWSVHGVKVRGDRIEWPDVEKNGRKFAVVTPPPAIRDQLEDEILTAYQQVRDR